MPAHPMPADIVFSQAVFESLPQVNIRQLSAFSLPAAPPPIRQPLRDTSPQVLRIGVEIHPAWLGKFIQCLHCRRQLHAVIGGMWLGAAQFFLVFAKQQ